MQVFDCQHCQSPFQVSAEFVGKAVQCPSCHQPNLIPATAPSPAQRSQLPTPGKSSATETNLVFACPTCQGQFQVPLAMDQKTVACPHCQTPILIQTNAASAQADDVPKIDTKIKRRKKTKSGKRGETFVPPPTDLFAPGFKNTPEAQQPTKRKPEKPAPQPASTTDSMPQRGRADSAKSSSPQSKAARETRRRGSASASTPPKAASSKPAAQPDQPPLTKSAKGKPAKSKLAKGKPTANSSKVDPNKSKLPLPGSSQTGSSQTGSSQTAKPNSAKAKSAKTKSAKTTGTPSEAAKIETRKRPASENQSQSRENQIRKDRSQDSQLPEENPTLPRNPKPAAKPKPSQREVQPGAAISKSTQDQPKVTTSKPSAQPPTSLKPNQSPKEDSASAEGSKQVPGISTSQKQSKSKPTPTPATKPHPERPKSELPKPASSKLAPGDQEQRPSDQISFEEVKPEQPGLDKSATRKPPAVDTPSSASPTSPKAKSKPETSKSPTTTTAESKPESPSVSEPDLVFGLAEKQPIDHLLPPTFDVVDPERLELALAGDDNKVFLPDADGGTLRVDKRIVHVEHEGEKVSLVVLSPEARERRRFIQNLIVIGIGIALLAATFYMLIT